MRARRALLCLLLLNISCRTDPAARLRSEARQRITAQGYEFTPAQFLSGAKSGDVQLVQDFLSAGMAVDSRGQFQNTALMEAAWGGHADTIGVLLGAGADAKAVNEIHGTALMYAVQSSSVEAVKAMIAAGADLDARDTQKSGTALMRACAQKGGRAMAQLIAEAGADINLADSKGDTALELASMYPDVELVDFLIRKGADVKGAPGARAVWAAANAGHSAVTRRLLDAGAPTDFPDSKGDTPLMRAIAGGNITTVNVILARGAATEHANKEGITPLMVAVESKNSIILELLLNRSQSVNARSQAGETALDIAIRSGQNDVADKIRAKGGVPGSALRAPSQ